MKASSPPEGHRVMIVEDEFLIAMELEKLLHDAGYKVIGPASTCRKALELIDNSGLDACVLDLNLDGEPVISVVSELNRHGVPFVLVSGYAHMEINEPELQGAKRLSKPVDGQHLLRVLNEIVAG